jgi:hypothetical protein
MKTKLYLSLFLLLFTAGMFAQNAPVTCDKITVDSVLNSQINKNNFELIITNHDSTTAWSPENFTVLSSNGDSAGHVILCQGCVILMHNRTGKFYVPKNDTNFVVPANYCCKLILAASGHQICDKQYNGCLIAGIQENSADRNAFHLFPNPAHNSVQLSESSSGSFRIINLRGQELRGEEMISKNKSIDISGFEPGMYFVQLYQNGVLKGTQKLIVQ